MAATTAIAVVDVIATTAVADVIATVADAIAMHRALKVAKNRNTTGSSRVAINSATTIAHHATSNAMTIARLAHHAINSAATSNARKQNQSRSNRNNRLALKQANNPLTNASPAVNAVATAAVTVHAMAADALKVKAVRNRIKAPHRKPLKHLLLCQ